MKINQSDEENYSKSCRWLLIITWICVGVVIFADTLTVFVDALYLSHTIFVSEFKTYVLVPSVFNLVIMAVVHTLSYILLKKEKYVLQACIYIVGVTLICFVLARSNQDISTNLIFFTIPIIQSLFYFNRKLITLSFVLSLCAFAAHVFIMLGDRSSGMNLTLLSVNIEVSIVIMVITFIIGMMIINRSEALRETAKEESIKTNEDILTGYLNHSGFYDDLDDTFKNAGREKGAFCLAIFDIDNFTLINEEFGHGFGDEVIEIMVDCINKSLVNVAKAYRYGGEEFVIICRGQEEIVINMADSILSEFRNKTELKLGAAVTVSGGICEYDPAQFGGKRDIFAAVDEALYAAKRLGKNQYVVWNEAIVRDSFVNTGSMIADDDLKDVAEG